MVSTLLILVGVAAATGILLGMGIPLAWRWYKRLTRTLVVITNPETRNLDLQWVRIPEDQEYVTIGNCDYKLEGGMGYQYEGVAFHADADRGKIFDVTPESVDDDADPIQRLSGHQLNQLRNDNRMAKYFAAQEGGLQALAKYGLWALGFILLFVIAILYVALAGFGYVG